MREYQKPSFFLVLILCLTFGAAISSLAKDEEVPECDYFLRIAYNFSLSGMEVDSDGWRTRVTAALAKLPQSINPRWIDSVQEQLLDADLRPSRDTYLTLSGNERRALVLHTLLRGLNLNLNGVTWAAYLEKADRFLKGREFDCYRVFDDFIQRVCPGMLKPEPIDLSWLD